MNTQLRSAYTKKRKLGMPRIQNQRWPTVYNHIYKDHMLTGLTTTNAARTVH